MNPNIDINKFLQSKLFKGIILAIGALIILLLVFQAGMMVGFRKANFSYRWADNYHQNFAGPRNGFSGDFMGKDFIEANGVFGSIIKISSSSLAIKGRNDIEKIILLNNDTVIKRFENSIKPSDLKIDEPIVVIGSPNDAGQIEAKLIRVLPPMPVGPESSSGSFAVPPRQPR